VVFLTGGPGGPSLSGLRSRLAGRLWRELRAERDLVFLDVRGTGYSEPEFCPELSAALYRLSFEALPEAERRHRSRQAMAECRDRMIASGVDLAAYHSTITARDLADLRVALGYEQWNLYGASYGTRLTLVTMRDAPQGIRSVILEAVIPPNAPEQRLTNYDRAISHLFDACAADPGCAADYPDLERRFYAMLDDLERYPLVIAMPQSVVFPTGQVTFDGDAAAAAIWEALYGASRIPLVPLLIRAFEARNRYVLRALLDVLAERGPPGLSRGLYLSVECYERAPYLTPEAVAADAQRAPRLAAYGDLFRALLEDCDAWHNYRASPAELAAVASEIPTLILTGSFDPVTPPEWGRLAAETLPNSYYVEARTGGHGPPNDACIRQITRDFINEPQTHPDASCNDARPPVTFVTDVRINPGIYRAATALRSGPRTVVVGWLGLTVLILLSAPLGWALGRLIRHLRKRPAAAGGLAATARSVAAAAALAAIAFVIALAWTMLRTTRSSPYILAFGVPEWAEPLFLLPWVVLVLGIAALGLATAAWRRGWWSVAARVHYTLVSLASLSFFAFLAYWRLL
jgi:pimeloyl-ACP methyl ester carboxylesterase